MEETLGILIPIIAILSTIALPMSIVIVAIVVHHRKKVAVYKTIEKAIDSNVSPEVIEKLVALSEPAKGQERLETRKKYAIEGLSLLAVGLSILAYHMIQNIEWILFPGILLTLLGAARLIIAIFIAKDQKEESE